MRCPKILTPALLAALVSCGVLLSVASSARAQGSSDDVILEMSQAFTRGDKAKLTALLPQARGNPLEPWAAYWELKARLEEASPQEVQDFLDRYAGTYQEDRLRNDWLLLLGQRREWDQFAAVYPKFRMRDDPEVECYALLIEQLTNPNPSPTLAEQVGADWFSLHKVDDGCTQAAATLIAAQKMKPAVAWRKARIALEANRVQVARNAVQIVAPDRLDRFALLAANPAKFLATRAPARTEDGRELVVLALVRMAANDPDAAATQLDSVWSPQLARAQRDWVWGAIGKEAALRLADTAHGYYAKVSRNADLSEAMLAWKARAALRAGQWRSVLGAIGAMGPDEQKSPTWVYWKARAIRATLTSAERADPLSPRALEATELFEAIAGVQDFYPQLALDALDRKVTVPPLPAPPTPGEMQAAQQNPGLARALYAIGLGLRSEGVREWNYTANLAVPGGMSDRERLAAAQLACEREVWDRCINTSDRTRSFIDFEQRFPMPHENAVLKQARVVGLDPAYVYGLIRQESRFVVEARSGVGASGLMQIMPATARWTAKKLGLDGYSHDQIASRDMNILLGTGYLKLILDDFQGSMPLAAAAYNAGPGRPRKWRDGPVLDAAVWIENVPFAETREYVKKVLANTTDYAAILTGKPQSLMARLGKVGPLGPGSPAPDTDLP
ncbi:MAG: Soluble lytic murein transglycosylase [Burkholderiaceae bacterium]|jgi:soluble lytic murein transglycosylase|nr:MAG: Soluble lytic murein transglycosylase [Burkholderiaceae bacterium]